jgi:hypothetical protein
MPQTRNNGAVVPVPSDVYNPPADMATMADSLDVVRRVSSQAAQNALTDLRVGTTIVRTDLTGQPLLTYNGTTWIYAAPEVHPIPGNNRGIVKGDEALATTNGFSVGFIQFPTPFPNACRSITLTASTATLTAVIFRVVARNAGSVEFAAYDAAGNGLPNTGIYVNYVAVGY